MEATKFINILKRHKYTLIAVPLLIVAIAYVLVRKLPDVYTSKATLSAGLADQSQQLLADKVNLQEEKTNQAFTNLIQMMQMRTVFDQLSYQLIIHDLTTPVPYRKPSKLLGTLNADARSHAVAVYTQLYNTRQPLTLSDPDQKGLNDVLISMQYDFAALSKKMKIYRVENSDFISVEFESDSPGLSEVAVNTLCKEFITYYTTLNKENELKSINYLNKLLSSTKDSLNDRMQMLKNFKIQNRVLNLNEQAKSLYAQMADYETRLEVVQKDIEANAGALKSIDNKFNNNERQYMDSKLTLIHQDILSSKQQLNALNDDYIKSGFDSSYLPKINTLKAVLAEQINQSTDKFILNPLNAKESLIGEKLKLEVSQELAKNSVRSIQAELDRLNKKFDRLVPNEAVVQAYESDISVASQEYLEILNKYNETSLQYNSGVKVKLIENAGIGEKQPSKKLILVVVSGIISFVFCLLVLFILFYLDNSLQSPVELAEKTDIPVLGHLPILGSSSLDLAELWRNNGVPAAEDFKNQLRSIRFEIDNDLNGAALVAITSLGAGEGKTMVALSLASAYLMTGKKVLLIDGNFSNNAITQIAQPRYFIEDYLSGKISLPALYAGQMTVLGNKAGDTSLFEISSEQAILERLSFAKEQYDIVIIETAGLHLLNKSKEWLKVSDKAVGVFQANKSLSGDEKQEVKYLQSIRTKFVGWVMNKLPANTSRKQPNNV
jgi:Mrp family chromosome partitioning ATPase/uncharacterized protein involved in exopolysaccharide biosynthesis